MIDRQTCGVVAVLNHESDALTAELSPHPVTHCLSVRHPTTNTLFLLCVIRQMTLCLAVRRPVNHTFSRCASSDT